MAKFGTLSPKNWGSFMPAQNPLSHKGPWYYRKTEMVMVQFETDIDVVAALIPEGLEIMEPATAFMVMEQNHYSTLGPYGEVYLGIMVTWEGQPHAYVPGVYVTEENSQIVGREVWGFGKRRAHRFAISKHGNGDVEVVMEVNPGDRALRAVMKPQANAPADALGETPLICLKIIPSVDGSAVPALAQLTSVTFKAQPVIGSDGKAEIYTGPGTIKLEDPSDVQIPVGTILGCAYAFFDADLPYGKVLKTYTAADFE
jgi:acetoacetate decarboxylase